MMKRTEFRFGCFRKKPNNAEEDVIMADRKTVKKEQYANEIIIQSPMGGEITTDQVVEKLPAGVDCVFIRVDQNKLWWIRGDETGNVDIWE